MLAETTLTIWMLGLMTHVGDDTVGGHYPKKAVAVVADRFHVHQAGMVIVDHFDHPLSRIQVYEFEAGDDVRFEHGVSAGYAEATDDFERFTPALREPLTNSLLDEPVREVRRHDAVLAWIHYPEGILEPVGLKYQEARFFRGNDVVRTQCVPASTVFNAPTHDEVRIIITHDNGTREPILTVDADAFIIVVNEPSLYSAARSVSPALHFTNYGALVEPRYGVIPRRIAQIEAGNPCADPKALAEHETAFDVLNRIFATKQFAKARQFQLAVPAAARHVSHSGLGLEILVRILIADDPACTNTGWP
jgi:hypothetical protein